MTTPRHFLWTLVLLILGLAVPVQAEERVTLGWGRMMVNDALADGFDRWRTGSYSVSRVRGPDWDGGLPATLGEVLEFRARAEVIAPANLTRPAANDRRYAGLLSFGIHSHFDTMGWDSRLGADLVLIGPQTGLSSVQKFFHRIVNMPEPRAARNQIGNRVIPTVSAEAARDLSFGPALTLRPFVEAQAGVETYVRVGGDVSLGQIGKGALMIRESVTGHHYRAVAGTAGPGFSLVLGGDVAQVFDSALFPDGGTAKVSPTRHRLRAGVHWQGKRSEAFYGVSLLGEEFETQPDTQLTGALSLRLRF